MIYCVSDIHGEFDRYKAMLETIHFSDSDHLYVIGDVIDRAPGGIDILQDIMTRKNVTMLLGNHEQMCLDDLNSDNIYMAKQLWLSNGGSVTRHELLYCMEGAARRKILAFLRSLPSSLNIEVNGEKFYLVHGFPSRTTVDRLWARPDIDTPNPFADGTTLIIGHTPVCFIQFPDRFEREKWLSDIAARGEHMKILHTPGYIDIDCGCGNLTPARRLACLRLDDMREFYT